MPQTLAALLEWRCARSAGKDAMVWLKDGLIPERILHFGALGEGARAWAKVLIAASLPGDRVLLVMPPGLGFAVVFWACLLAGRIAVPLPAPEASRRKNLRRHLEAVMSDARAALIVTTVDFAAALSRDADNETPKYSVLQADPMGLEWPVSEAAVAAVLPEIDADQPAYLQYTSGSTGTPRGVVLTHRQVLAQARAASQAVGLGPADRLLSWLPHHHDFGLLLGIIAPVQTGATAFLMSPMSFLRRPLRWLEGLSRHRITHSGAPNFALAACVRDEGRLAWQGDLGALRSLSCGAEPIRPATLRAFIDAFSQHGLSPLALAPAYGMAEVVLCATMTPVARGPRFGRSKDGHEWVSCGPAIDGLEISIIDVANSRRCAEGEVGEIWIRGDSVGEGYWSAPEATELSFSARVQGEQGAWLRSGDLGFLSEGELVVTGRMKDVLILNGRNLAPQDLEWTAQAALPGLRHGYGVAFAVDGVMGEAVVLVQEVDRRLDPETAHVAARAIRDALWLDHEVALQEVVLVCTGSLPRTSSGKLRRGASREAYLSGALKRVDETTGARSPLPPTGTAARLAILWAETLRAPPQYLEDHYFDLGGDSLSATRLASRVNAAFGVPWTVADAFQHPTLIAMADALDRLSRHADGAEARVGSRSVALTLKRSARDGDLPVTSSQRRMWMVQQLTPGTTAYNMGFAFRIEGPLCPSIFQQAFEAVVARHEAFRTRLIAVGDDVVQRIDAVAPAGLCAEDVSFGSVADRETRMQQRAGAWLQTPFDLEQGPLHRALLLKMDAEEHVLMWSIHHSIGDLWSFALLFDELSRDYAAIEAGKVPAPASEDYDYADYAVWLRAPEQEAALEPEIDYWLGHLAGLKPLALPADRERRGPPDGHGGRLTLALPEGWRERIRERAAALKLTPFMLLLAVFQLQLSRCCGQDDIAVGTPIANRQQLAAERLVGTLVNTVVMRTSLSGVLDFPALAQRVRQTAITAYAHQEAPFERLVERLVDARDTHLPPLVQVLFNLVVAPVQRLDFAGRRIGPVDVERTGAQFDLSLSIDLEVFGQLHLEYASDRFSRASAMQWADSYLHVLGQVLDNAQRRLVDYVVDMPSPATAPRDAPSGSAVEASEAAALLDEAAIPSVEASGLEVLVLRLASEVLDTPVSNALDNFFDVGGHSLLALRFAHRMQESTGFRPGVLAIAQSSFRALAMTAAANAQAGSDAIPRPNSP